MYCYLFSCLRSFWWCCFEGYYFGVFGLSGLFVLVLFVGIACVFDVGVIYLCLSIMVGFGFAVVLDLIRVRVEFGCDCVLWFCSYLLFWVVYL